MMSLKFSTDFANIQKLKLSLDSIKQDYMKEQRMYEEECNRLGMPCYFVLSLLLPFFMVAMSSDQCVPICSGVNLKPIVDEAECHRLVLADNRKLFNEIQELRGDIISACLISNCDIGVLCEFSYNFSL